MWFNSGLLSFFSGFNQCLMAMMEGSVVAPVIGGRPNTAVSDTNLILGVSLYALA